MAWQDTTFFDANNSVEIAHLDSYTIVNASVALGSPDMGCNSSLGTGYAEIAYARPREYFARIEYDF